MSRCRRSARSSTHDRTVASRFGWLLAIVVLTACGTGGGGGPEVRADAGGDQSVFVGDTVDLDASASRPDDGTLQFAWSFSSRPAGSDAAFGDAESERTSFVADVEGRYDVALTVRHDAGSASDTVAIVAELSASVLLEGDPSDPAVGAVYDLHVPASYADDAYERDTEDGRDAVVLRREIEIAFVLDATIGDVNEILTDLGGGIVSMLAGVPIVVVQIPDPGDLPSLRALLADLEADRRIEAAFATYVVDEPEPVEPAEEEAAELESAALPPDADPTDGPRTSRIDHHMAVRAHAAWNAQAAMVPLNQRPWIVIQDSFGDDTPADGYDLVLQDGDFGDGSPARHGYHVLGILGGAFDPPDTVSSVDRADVTGIVPGTLRVRAVDGRTSDANTWARRTNQVLQRINAIVNVDADANIVVTSSQNSRSLGVNGTASQAATWIVKVRLAGESVTPFNILNLIRTEGAGRESRFVHATSAGNARWNPGSGTWTRWPAEENSVYAYAALADDTSIYGVTLPALRNVHVVENRRHAGYGGTGAARPAPQCVTNSSIVGGTLGAPGGSIWSMGRCTSTNPNGTCATSDAGQASAIGGTSMSTPQVAGLAAYAWSLNPSLSVANVVTYLAETAVDDGITAGAGCNPTVTAPAPVIDAYAMVTRAAGTTAWRAVLDFDDDGTFDENDLDAWLSAWGAYDGNRDYGRFDLNGDGGIGAENRTERVDLNGDGTFGFVTRAIGTASVTYDESAVSDLDVLCYHAYGSAYLGSGTARSSLLRTVCGDAVVQIVQPTDGSSLSTGTVDAMARITTFRPDGWTPDTSMYRISWYEMLNSGERRFLGATEDGELLTAELVCGDATLVARSQHRNVPRLTEDSVAITSTGAGPGVWVPSATPESSSVYLSVNSPGSVTFNGSFRRLTCDGTEPMPESTMRWVDLDDGSVAASGASLTVHETDVLGGPKNYELRSTLDRSGTLTRTVVPCSVFAEFGSSGGLPPCSNATFEGLFQDAVGRYYADLEEALRIKEWLDRNVEERFGPDGPPDPFFADFATLRRDIIMELGGSEGEIVDSWFSRLFDILATPDPNTWVDDVRQLEATVLEEAVDYTAAPWESWLELFLGASRTVLGTYELYAPVESGGQDVSGRMPFLLPEERALLRQGLEPARLAVRAHVTSFVDTHESRDGGGLGTYDVELAIESGVMGGLGGALQVTGFLDPAWPHD